MLILWTFPGPSSVNVTNAGPNNGATSNSVVVLDASGADVPPLRR